MTLQQLYDNEPHWRDLTLTNGAGVPFAFHAVEGETNSTFHLERTSIKLLTQEEYDKSNAS